MQERDGSHYQPLNFGIVSWKNAASQQNERGNNMETYQPIFDAVRSKLSNCDIGEAVASVFREANLSSYAERVSNVACDAAAEYMRPSAIMKPKLSIDGNQWCALYGENLQDGLAGFGDSPSEAMFQFDRAWCEKLKTKN